MTGPAWIIERAPRDEDADPFLSVVTGRSPENDDVARLVRTVEAHGLAVHVVRKPPMADFLVGMRDDDVFEIRPDGPVFAYGSTTLGLVSERLGWAPGFVDGPAMDECDARWGAHMPNHGARIETIGTMAVPNEPVFIRPLDDGKPFAGKVETPESFAAWRAGLLDVTGWTNLPPTTRVVVGRPLEIDAEWRLLIVDGMPAAASLYRDGPRLRTERGAPADVLAFAAARAEEWSPRAAFVMDVAATPEGLRIVETNSVSSAGLYRMDQDAYVSAISRCSIFAA